MHYYVNEGLKHEFSMFLVENNVVETAPSILNKPSLSVCVYVFIQSRLDSSTLLNIKFN